MNKKIEVIQEENSDCGISCLASIIKYYNGYIPLEILRMNTNTNEFGTNAYELINYAKKIGLDAYGKRINNLRIKKLPVIAHLKLDNGLYHFVVIYEIKNNYLLIMDPSEGLKKIQKDVFIKQFNNTIIVFNQLSILPIYKDNRFIKDKTIEYVRDNKKTIFILLIISVFILIISLIINMEIKILEYNNNFIILLFILILLNEILQYVKNNILINISIKYNKRIINYFVNHIFKLPSNYLKLKTNGEISTRFNELNDFSNKLINIIVDLFFIFIMMILSLFIILYIDKTLYLCTLFISIIYLLFNIKVYKSLYNIIKYSINMEENYNSNILDYISKINTIKHIFNYNYFKNNINKNLISRNKTNKELDKKLFKINMFNNIFINITILLFLYFILKSNYNISNSLLLFILINYYIMLIKKIIDYYPAIIFYKNIINKNNEFLSFKNNEKSIIKLNKINIKLNAVSYNINGNIIIKNFNYIIKNNKKVFLYGQSGCGKSTLLKIINNEITNYKGRVLINSVNIINYDLSNIISYTSQNEEIFNDTIRNNLLLNKKISETYLNKIISICKLDSVINNLGLDGFIINSVSLSGGEKNRIILARSLIHSKKIIVLDEVLKEVDRNLEIDIVKNIIDFFKNRTIIYVSHKDIGYLFDDVITFRKE